MNDKLPVRLPLPLKIFWCINATLAMITVVVMRGYFYYHLHRSYPFTTPFLPSFHFWDLRAYEMRFQSFHSPAFFTNPPASDHPFEYPAPMALGYKAL